MKQTAVRPPESRVLVHVSSTPSRFDRAVVALSSLLIVGSPVWVPLMYTALWKRWRRVPKTDRKRRAVYGTMLMSLLAMAIVGPHRSIRVGKWLNARKWRLWASWLKFLSFEVVADRYNSETSNLQKEKAILAIIPHGIFPFALAFAALPQAAVEAFGEFRPVVATATALFPLVRTILGWLGAVDASRSSVDRALEEGSRIGLAPGGIAEMFVGYPKLGTHPDDEYAIIKPRKGFVRMAVKHGRPVIPVYCFGASKLMKRVQLPHIFEKLSNMLRISLCLFFGQGGLPIPFRQRLMYVIGRPILPPYMDVGQQPPIEGSPDFDRQVNEMHERFCDELIGLFNRHKDSYGWERKQLQLI